MNRRLTLGVALAAALSIAGASAAFAQDEESKAPFELEPLSALDFGVLPNTEEVGGQPITSWIEKLGDWFALTPFDQHFGPQNDCQAAQEGPVFFLSNVPFGMTAIYDCSIGADQNILVEIGGGFGVSDDDDKPPEVMRGIALDNSMMIFNPKLIIDGQPVPVGGSTWFNRDPYTLDLPEGNIFGMPAGPFVAASNGWYLMLEPLAPGPHTIIISDDTLRPVISTDDVDIDSRVVVDEPRGVGETVTATAVFNITVPDPDAAAE